MYYSYVEIEYVATSFSPARMDLALKLLKGPGQDLSNFQMAPIPILSVLTCSTSSPHDILKVSRKIINHNLPVGWDKGDD
jgi:hypothetical protein